MAADVRDGLLEGPEAGGGDLRPWLITGQVGVEARRRTRRSAPGRPPRTARPQRARGRRAAPAGCRTRALAPGGVCSSTSLTASPASNETIAERPGSRRMRSRWSEIAVSAWPTTSCRSRAIWRRSFFVAGDQRPDALVLRRRSSHGGPGGAEPRRGLGADRDRGSTLREGADGCIVQGLQSAIPRTTERDVHSPPDPSSVPVGERSEPAHLDRRGGWRRDARTRTGALMRPRPTFCRFVATAEHCIRLETRRHTHAPPFVLVHHDHSG